MENIGLSGPLGQDEGPLTMLRALEMTRGLLNSVTPQPA